MTYAEITETLKSYYAKALNRLKARMADEGPLPKSNVANIEKDIARLNDMIANECDDFEELVGLEDIEEQNKFYYNQMSQVMAEEGMELDLNSPEYAQFKNAFKFALRNYRQDTLTANNAMMNYSLLDNNYHNQKPTKACPLHEIIYSYVDEVKDNMKESSLKELRVPLNLLLEYLGSEFDISGLDRETGREFKTVIQALPSNRNKNPETKNLPIKQQIKVPDIQKISPRTVKKYLGYLSGFAEWTKNHGYVEINAFDGLMPRGKAETTREMFSDEETALIFAELDKGKDGLANTDMKYWSTLLFFYTGARRNEIASLTPHDVKYDETSDTWYLDIQKGKTAAATRLIPIHSELIKRGFLDYVKEVKKMKGDSLRLLHELTYTEAHGWGRKLTRWFSNQLLKKLGIKTRNNCLHSVRHTFITNMKATDAEYRLIDTLAGHAPTNVSEKNYTHYNIKHLPQLKETIEKLGYL